MQGLRVCILRKFQVNPIFLVGGTHRVVRDYSSLSCCLSAVLEHAGSVPTVTERSFAPFTAAEQKALNNRKTGPANNLRPLSCQPAWLCYQTKSLFCDLKVCFILSRGVIECKWDWYGWQMTCQLQQCSHFTEKSGPSRQYPPFGRSPWGWTVPWTFPSQDELPFFFPYSWSCLLFYFTKSVS